MESGRYPEAVHDVADDCFGCAKLAGLKERLADNPVRENRHSQRLDVIGDDVVSS